MTKIILDTTTYDTSADALAAGLETGQLCVRSPWSDGSGTVYKGDVKIVLASGQEWVN